ncbi:MGH1-like glycoside hydrolase domain-containing protein [Coraliomargarita sinensis]|uniref:MGH1-like glycoside hydrolase domain-containing protein n=1 Tax=Coraliomargarita sinensis TaxID=2174842 RepID=UPI0018EEA443|nr:glycosyl hydrolase family 65 protein [Coraliomargarita sinensis]
MLSFQSAHAVKGATGILSHTKLKSYVERFNADDEELYANIPNSKAYRFLQANIPLFECPDEDFERTYYFRWWTYRKHIRETPEGYVITEFLPEVSWSRKYNTISCPSGHHFYEGRWLHNPVYLDDYAKFWLRGEGMPRQYSCWLADAIYARHLVNPDPGLMVELLDSMVENYEAWEKTKLGELGLFYQIDDRDGMEVSIGGSGYRATINSYMYGDAKAIARIARLAGRAGLEEKFEAKAAKIKSLLLSRLWDPKDKFFKVLDKTTLEKADVREQHGYTPWYFNLPEPGEGYESAWKQLVDPGGFHAPYGPTTAEQRHPGFSISYEGHECQWNGPSWPLATSVTLTALANVLNNYEQDAIGKRDYFETLQIYTRSHLMQREDGKIVPWIDENLHPYTGKWIARTRLKNWKEGGWSDQKGGKERGKDYNHSSYCDLIITGLVGLRPRADNVVEVNPLLPEVLWDYFCLDQVRYKGRVLTIIWDRTGEKYGRGKGLTILADGKTIAHSPRLECIIVELL